MTDYNGILVVDKPAGWTSHDVVRKTKNMLGGCKVGHTGTLDPFATGVLILLIGSATKVAKYFEYDDKSYDAEITFGTATDTCDPTGAVVSTSDPGNVDRDTLTEYLQALVGETLQTPPMYSARKVGGKRLYKLARKGLTIDVEPRPITIHTLEYDLTSFPVIRLWLSCSKGTYIRSLARDIGESVGCPAHLSALRRTQAGMYGNDEAIDFQTVADTGDATILIDGLKPIPETMRN